MFFKIYGKYVFKNVICLIYNGLKFRNSSWILLNISNLNYYLFYSRSRIDFNVV